MNELYDTEEDLHGYRKTKTLVKKETRDRKEQQLGHQCQT